jgi:hypothetical protein
LPAVATSKHESNASLLVVSSFNLEALLQRMRFGSRIRFFDVHLSDLSFERFDDAARDFAKNLSTEMASFLNGF